MNLSIIVPAVAACKITQLFRQSTGVTVDVLFDASKINCGLVVGHEWMALFLLRALSKHAFIES